MNRSLLAGLVAACLILILGAWLFFANEYRTGPLRDSQILDDEIQATVKQLDALVPMQVTVPSRRFGSITNRSRRLSPARPIHWTIDLGAVFPIEEVFVLPCIYPGTSEEAKRAYLFPSGFRILAAQRADFKDSVTLIEQSDHANDVRSAYPLRVACEATAARYVRIEITRLNAQADTNGDFRAALSEIFVFSGGVNVALGKAVTGVRYDEREGYFQPEFLVDGQTPLGLPIRRSEVGRLGWHARVSPRNRVGSFVELRFAVPVEADAVRLFPVKNHLQLDVYGFPKSFQLEAELPSGGWVPLAEIEDSLDLEPQNNPVTLAFAPVEIRALRLRASELASVIWGYTMAFSEIQVMRHGRNVGAVASVLASDEHHDEAYWSRGSLLDGQTNTGRILSWQSWLKQLAQRKQLEAELATLYEARAALDVKLQRGQSSLLWLGLAWVLAFVISALALFIIQRRDRLQEISRIRERIAGDLHDEVGSNLGSIQILSHVRAGQLPKLEDMRMIQLIAADTVSAVRDVVWFLRPRRFRPGRFVDHLKEAGRILLESHEYTFTAGEEILPIELSDQKMRDLMLFYREALYNIVKHAQADEVSVALKLVRSELTLTIADNGCGLSPESLELPSTLRALKQRAARLDGQFKVTSELGRGTTLTLSLSIDSNGKP